MSRSKYGCISSSAWLNNNAWIDLRRLIIKDSLKFGPKNNIILNKIPHYCFPKKLSNLAKMENTPGPTLGSFPRWPIHYPMHWELMLDDLRTCLSTPILVFSGDHFLTQYLDAVLSASNCALSASSRELLASSCRTFGIKPLNLLALSCETFDVWPWSCRHQAMNFQSNSLSKQQMLLL